VAVAAVLDLQIQAALLMVQQVAQVLSLFDMRNKEK
jgi:hypothetical protein